MSKAAFLIECWVQEALHFPGFPFLIDMRTVDESFEVDFLFFVQGSSLLFSKQTLLSPPSLLSSELQFPAMWH